MARISESRFRALLGPAHPESKVSSCYQALVAAYTHPTRHYHALWHIEECLTLFDEHRDMAEEPESLELAIWFHDFVYQPGSRTNETCSAEAAAAWLRFLDCTESIATRVRSLVLCTSTHEILPGAPADAALLIDVDLTPLAAAPDRFERNATLIRREFARIPDDDFARGHARMLEGFLARPRIYLTDVFHSRYEAQARANLQRALANNGVHD